MSWQAWLAFASVSAVILIIPGSVVTVASVYAINVGRSRALAIVPGAVIGDFVAMAASFLGIGAVMNQFPTVFASFKVL